MSIINHGKEDDGEEPLYSSIHDPSRDWADPSTVLAKLAEFQVPVPASVPPALAADRLADDGNRLVFHCFDRSPKVTPV